MQRSKWVFIALLVVLVLCFTAGPLAAEGRGRKSIFGQDYTLKAGERLEQDLTVFGGRVTLERDSLVAGDIAIMGGEALLNGQVLGDVVAVGGSVELGPNAVIEKDLVVFGNVRRHPDAQVHGNTVEGIEASKRFRDLPGMFKIEPVPGPKPPVAPRPDARVGSGLSRFMQSVASILATLFVVALIKVLLPDNLERISAVMLHSPLLSLGMGGLTIVLAVMLLVLSAVLILICIGVPLAIVLVVAFTAAAFLGLAAAGDLVGKKLVQVLNLKGYSPLVVTLLGTLAIALLATVPCLGFLFALVVLSWGIGGVALTRLGTVTYALGAPFAMPPAAPSAPPAVTPPPPSTPEAPGIGRRPGDTHPLDDSPWNDHEPEGQTRTTP